ncbi:hypothetical protein HZS_6416 [Henneguya salminicola]|nr:hypothetical protein HZS_6416 [Henneguya salminicola]
MDQNIEIEVYSLYYRHMYPFELIQNWLSYGDKTYFSRREFSIMSNNEMYQRYLSYDSFMEFKNDIIQKSPSKIDIGAVFSSKPRDHKIIASDCFISVERELVFDIDLTDYDDVRFCCSNTKICPLCWSLVVLAASIIDRALEDDFGFKHRMWVYSGRRGIHCWVCDARARKLSPGGRQAIVDYLSVIKGGENRAKKVHLFFPLHHSLLRCVPIILNYFENIYVNCQSSIFDKENIKYMIDTISNKDCQRELQLSTDKICSLYNPEKKWEAIKTIVNKYDNKVLNFSDCFKNSSMLIEMIFQLCYPRLDVNVSKSLNHLLKSPFCIHPKTGKFIRIFSRVVIQLLEDEADQSYQNQHKRILADSLGFFKNFINGCEIAQNSVDIF